MAKNEKPIKRESDTDIFGEHAQRLNEKQLLFLSDLISNTTGVKSQIFANIGISRATFYRWKKENPSFATCYEIADEIVQDSRLEWCMAQFYKMVEKGNKTLFMGKVIDNAPIPAMVKVEIIKTIMKTTRAGKLALSPNIPEEQQIETAPKPTLSEILQKFNYKPPHSRGIESIDKEESDEGE
jgi:hypothetical protein